MNPEDVPAEWVDALRDVIAPHMGCQDCGTGPGECPCRDAARAALAAVIPLVQKEEREACYEDAQNEYLAATNDDEDEGNHDMVARLKSQGAADGAARIMAAIRARGGA